MKKKLLFSLLALLCSVGAWAIDNPTASENFVYSVDTNSKTASIVELNVTPGEELSIPKSMTYYGEEYAVTSIKTGALTGYTLKRLFLPETIKSVEVNCFSGSTIDNIYIYNTTEVTKIEGEGDLGLKNRPNLFVKRYPASIYLWQNTSWSSVARRISPVPGAVVDGIAYFLYGPYDDLGEEGTATVVPNETPYTGDITIPGEIWSNGRRFPVDELGELAFADSGSDLKTLTLNYETKYIQKDCFRGVSLETLTTYSDKPLTKVGDRYNHDIIWGEGFQVNKIRVAYEHVSEFRSDNSFRPFADKIFAIPVIKDGIAYEFYLDNHQATVAENYYNGNITIPATVEHDRETFNVTAIAEKAFYNCKKLTGVSLPNGITTLSTSCFENCSSLTNVVLPNSITSLGEKCFQNCSSLTQMELPNSITTLGTRCFENCSKLPYVVLPNGITSLPDVCFSGCRALKYIEMPKNLESVGMHCFFNCYSLKALSFPASVKYLGTELFDGTSLTDIEFVNPAQELDNDIYWALLGETERIWRGVYNCTLHIPTELIAEYKEKNGWKLFKEITDGTACTHLYDSAVWLWEDNDGASVPVYFECNHCNHRTDVITANQCDKVITVEPKCTETGKYELRASATSPSGITCSTAQEFIIPALHTSNIGLCDICGEKIGDHLAFKAVNGDVTVGLKSNHEDGVIFPLEYSTDRITWNQMDGDVTITEGTVVCFRSGYDEVMGDMHYNRFTMTSDNGGRIEASGNIMSLLDKTYTSTTVGGYGFIELFKDCTPLLTAPKLPATRIGRYSYKGMFQGCTNFNCDVDLPAIAIYPECYENMFTDCSSMSSSIIVRAKEFPDPVSDVKSMKLNKYFTDWVKGTAGVSVFINQYDEYVIKHELIEESRDHPNIVKWGNYFEKFTFNDNESIYISGQGDEEYVYNVTIGRSMTNDGWYTICLPFDISLKDSPFSQAAEFNETDGNTFKFSSVSELKIGVGYIVKVDHEMPELTFQKVKIPKKVNEHLVESDFQGIFSHRDIDWSSYVIGSGNTVNPITGSNHLKGYRAYFKNVPQGSDAKAFRFTVDDNDDDIATSISLPLRESQSGAIYNLQGQRVNASHRGIVIKNGRKYINK